MNGDTFSFDAEDRLVQVALNPVGRGGTETYFYDGAGQRVERRPLRLQRCTDYIIATGGAGSSGLPALPRGA